MNIHQALKELEMYYDGNVEIITPGGRETTILEASIEEYEALENGFIDTNEYGLDILKGIFYKTVGGGYGDIAYRIKGL